MLGSFFSRRLVVLAAVAAIGCFGMGRQAECGDSLLWYDGFTLEDDGGDYVAGAALYDSTAMTGQTGGSGTFFSGPWEGTGDEHWVEDQSLHAPNYTSVGGSIGGTSFPTAGCCNTGRTARIFADSWDARQNGTFYIGFLASYGNSLVPLFHDITDMDGNVIGSERTLDSNGEPAWDVHYRALEIHDGGFDDDANLTLRMGYSTFFSFGGPVNENAPTNGPDGENLQLSIGVEDAVSGEFTNKQFEEHLEFARDRGALHSFVMKFELSDQADSDTISVYLDPESTTEPSTPSVEFAGINFLADRMSPINNFVFNGPSTSPVFDELRVGGAFEDVVIPLPEPTSVCLLGLGVVGLLATRRKRS